MEQVIFGSALFPIRCRPRRNMKAVLCCVSLLIATGLAWNVDTEVPIIFAGSKDSYFGFSVALHDNSRGSFALVSATRANSTQPARRSLHQPGVVYKCDITTKECEEVVLQTAASDASSVGPPLSYISKEDDMWLGVSLDVQSRGRGYILACGHLWRNQQSYDDYYVNGGCYAIDREFTRSSYKALLPLTNRDKQKINGVYYYAYATAGFSATFAENTDDFDILMGAPGFGNWRGTVVGYSEDPNHALRSIVPADPDRHPYLGYSVTSGRFYAFGRMQFAAGAPRDGGHKGRVYVSESLSRDQMKVNVLQRLEGEQIGEYFGACVVGVNFNGDSYTDLLVGSPLYSLPGLGEEGKVYVYTSDGEVLKKDRELVGLKKPRSRFGTTIADVGDVNQDGFADVAIGAPYEDDRGAIYIYHGSGKGLDETYKQRISAADVNQKLSGFGMAISKGKDIDNNKYPDILVGSYASDNAILLRTRPLVKVFGSMKFDPPQINIKRSLCTWNGHLVPCFNVTFCLQYEGNHVPDQIGVSTKLSSARRRDGLHVRRYLFDGSKLTSYIVQDITIIKGEEICYDKQAYVTGDSKDFISPIQMTLNFTLTPDVTNEEPFCKFCPMLHPDFPSSIIGMITFHTGCGEDGICTSDLVLTINVQGLSSDKLVVGQDNVIVLSIEVQNLEEPAYNTYVDMYIPSDVQIINQDSCENKIDSLGLPTINCDAGNPLPSGHVAKFEMKLDTSGISTDLDYLTIRANATTASKEAKPKDNYKVINIPLKILADIAIVGNPIVEEIIFEKKHLEIDEPTDIIHQYTVLKYLPAPITSVSVEFLVPTTIIDEDMNFLHLKDFKINDGSSDATVPATCDFRRKDELLSTTVAPEDHTKVITPKPRRKRSVDPDEGSSSVKSGPRRTYILNCNTSICTKVTCTAGPFKDTHSVANFRIYGSVNISDFKTILDRWDQIRIVTEGKVRIEDKRENIQPVNHRPDQAEVFTTIQHPYLLSSRGVPIWIIILSVIAGIVLLVIVSLGLIKMGFFQRKEKDMMVKAKLEECQPVMTPETNGVCTDGAKGAEQNGA